MARIDAFVNRFVDSARRDWRIDGPAFTLVLGAGASRSAGVPLAGEMVDVLERVAQLAGVRVPPKPPSESSLSWTFRYVTAEMPWEDEFFDYQREFIMACICRARREPNLAHLLAAHLCEAHVIGDIVTTNFDDLAPAAFWELPLSSAYVEPYIVYHPRTEAELKVAPGVPVIIKAHGHHNRYGLDIIDRDIKSTAASVKHLVASRPKPEIGYLVVGYSGAWPDGVIATLSDQKITRGKTIYWFFVRHKPNGPYVEAISKRNDIRFIRIVDADALFLRMWHELHMDAEQTNPPLFEEYHLFNLARKLPFRRPASREVIEKWWDVTMLRGTNRDLRNYPRLVELRQELLPLLKALDKWDDDCLLWDCAPESVRQRIRDRGGADPRYEPPEMRMLSERVPIEIRWTRRNRKLLRLALTNHVDPVMPFIVLHALCQTQG
jgi:hypothetical protein